MKEKPDYSRFYDDGEGLEIIYPDKKEKKNESHDIPERPKSLEEYLKRVRK